MSTPATCPQCGAALEPDAPEGLCPRCLVAMNLAHPTRVTGEAAAPTAGDPRPDTAAAAGDRAAPAAPPAPAELAAKFPQLAILECLGRGGMGVVYKARQPRLDRLVALKIITPGREADPHFAERFTREAQALARLNHPNIVTVHDFGETDGLFYFIMEYVDGLTLRQMLAQGRMTPAEALSIVPRVCEALQFAHEQGVVHRDIKPENILLDKNGRVKIADFGIARMLGQETGLAAYTKGQAVLGTPFYMAPEQLEKPGAVDHRADIYSLGVVFYEMLTGELPLGRFPPPSQTLHVDVRLDQVVLRALEKQPERRYQQAGEVKTDVETIAAAAKSAPPPGPASAPAGAPTPAAPPPAPPPAPVKPLTRDEALQRLRVPAIGLLLAAALSLLPLLWIFGRRHEAPSLVNWSIEMLPGLLVLLSCAIVVYGAVQMLRLGSYGWALAAAIFAIVTPPGACLGLIFGIWSVIVLARSEVRAAFASAQAAAPPSPAMGVTPPGAPVATPVAPPRISRCALAGAVWAGLFFLCFFMYFGAMVGETHVNHTFGPGGDFIRSSSNHTRSFNAVGFIFLPLVPLAVLAPLGTTILGWVAVAQIRRSGGALTGLGLAVFDGLLFPLLLLDALPLLLLYLWRT